MDVAPFESASGDIYASEELLQLSTGSGRVLHLDFPPPGPVIVPEPCSATPIKSTSATLNARINPEGKATTFHFEYVTDADFKVDGFAKATETDESSSIGEDVTLKDVSQLVTGLDPETIYHCRVVAINADGKATGDPGEFKTKAAFEFGPIWASEVGSGSAVLNAVVNPLGSSTQAQFEYVDAASFNATGFLGAKVAPAGKVELGSGETPITVSAAVSGLLPGTAYRYRLRVENPLFPSGLPCPGQEGIPAQETICPGEPPTLTTFGVLEGLPDGRAYELVSPAEKNSAEVGTPERASGLGAGGLVIRTQAAATSGEAVTYTSWTSFGDADGAQAASQYLSKRSAGGWGTENISPFGFMQNPLNPPYRGFSPDLSTAGFVISEPALVPGALTGFENLYQRDNATGTLEALTAQPAPDFTPVEATGLGSFCSSYAGASADGSRSFFASNGAFTQSVPSAPVGTGFSLYERSPSGLALVSVLPDGTPAPPAPSTRFGNEGGACTMGQGIIARAVSANGSKVFWSYGASYNATVDGKPETVQNPLLARIDGSETVQLDARAQKEGKGKFGVGPGGKGTFWGASVDGSRAFFTAPGQLLPTMSASGALYRYDTGSKVPSLITPATISPEIEGVIGVSEAGDYLYFVAGAALTGGEENAAGQKAEEGGFNLYLWHEGEAIRFIAGLSPLDEGSWNSSPEGLTARVSADGKHLAFLSTETEALSGYDNTVAVGTGCQPGNENKLEGSPGCLEAYIYDAAADALTCASCNPSGARPLGPANLPAWTNPFEGPRYLSANGRRLFFESRDALSPADTNGKRDIYEFERSGEGSCTSTSATYSPKADGCVALISSGRSEDNSFLIDASADGRDVFFSTRQPLVGWDLNPNFDVYDARVGGGFPEPPVVPVPCEGEGCKAPANTPPAAPSPATDSFNGPGNPKPKPHKKSKKKKSKKHAKKKGKGKQGKKQKKSSKKGRASR